MTEHKLENSFGEKPSSILPHRNSIAYYLTSVPKGPLAFSIAQTCLTQVSKTPLCSGKLSSIC